MADGTSGSHPQARDSVFFPSAFLMIEPNKQRFSWPTLALTAFQSPHHQVLRTIAAPGSVPSRVGGMFELGLFTWQWGEGERSGLVLTERLPHTYPRILPA